MSNPLAFKAETSFLWGDGADLVPIGIVIISILALILYFVRHKLTPDVLKASGKAHRISVQEQRVLSSKTALYLIEVDGKSLLIIESSASVSAVDAHAARAQPSVPLPRPGSSVVDMSSMTR